MTPVIWGLDLKEMQWAKFKSSYMFSREYHLRRSKMVVYQCAMILCVGSESVGTAALTDYVKEQSRIEGLHSSAAVHNDDFVGVAAYNIFVGIYVATIFGSAFFFDLFWPERHESRSVRRAWKVCSVLAGALCLADALALTVIVATHRSTISADSADQLAIANMVINPPLVYKHNARAIASVALLWPGWVATVASAGILWASHVHDDVYGPKSAHARRRHEKYADARRRSADPPVSTRSSSAPTAPSAPSPPRPTRLSKLSAYRSGKWNPER